MHPVQVAGLRQRQRPKGRPATHTAPVHSPTVVHNAEKTELHINFRSDFNQYFVQKRKEE